MSSNRPAEVLWTSSHDAPDLGTSVHICYITFMATGDIPKGYDLVLRGRDDQWTARLIPEGHTLSKWSPPAIEAKAKSMEEAVSSVLAKCAS